MKNHENKKYLTAMMKYIYDKLHKDTLESRRPTYRAWRRARSRAHREEEEEIWRHPTNLGKRGLGREEEEGKNGGHVPVTEEQRQQEKDCKILGGGREEAANT